jgi:hypothetical protein
MKSSTAKNNCFEGVGEGNGREREREREIRLIKILFLLE